MYKGYIFASVLLVAPVLGALAAGMSNRLSVGTQIMLRAELTAAIYRKALRLSTRCALCCALLRCALRGEACRGAGGDAEGPTLDCSPGLRGPSSRTRAHARAGRGSRRRLGAS